MRRRVWLTAFGACLAILGCGRLARTFLDLPPPAPRAASAAPVTGAREERAALSSPADTALPAIERTLDPDTALALLPRDHAGNVDWASALHRGVIRPRPAPGARPGEGESGFRFAYDFYLPGPDSTFDAYFPHSTHTEWIACQHCHGRIVRYQGTRMTMKDILEDGRYCGECHGKVAFPVVTGCERCHPRLELPPDRTEPALIGDIVMTRAAGDSGALIGAPSGQLPPARFPHWVHRVRYQCKACHTALFEPRAGANRILMRDISEGKACGRCHDGTIAFRAGFGACDRCHTPPKEPAGGE
jgi:c(7)-type cytochrome triheme protein